MFFTQRNTGLLRRNVMVHLPPYMPATWRHLALHDAVLMRGHSPPGCLPDSGEQVWFTCSCRTGLCITRTSWSPPTRLVKFLHSPKPQHNKSTFTGLSRHSNAQRPHLHLVLTCAYRYPDKVYGQIGCVVSVAFNESNPPPVWNQCWSSSLPMQMPQSTKRKYLSQYFFYPNLASF